MAKLKNFLILLFFNYYTIGIAFLIFIFVAIKTGKHINYNLFYSSHVEERVKPLEKRIERLESLMTNGPIRLQ